MALTRYAPTPSGFLHAGNLRNFALTATLADDVGATIALRIDDADAARYRREYVDDIFRVLIELGLPWTVGPRDADDFETRWSQRHRTDSYRRELQALRAALPTYACTCSRTQQRMIPTGGCAAGCRTRGLPWVEGEFALRVVVPEGTSVDVGGVSVALDEALGDFVIWRRDGLPAYQLVSVIEDRDLGTTHIVRGVDLLASSAAQVFLAPALGADNVAAAAYVHHPLVLDDEGRKLSKSQREREDR
ncbi:MAG: glutamate--tRNA ligase family protein [Candidatus Nanopelagicales bacterium]